MENKHIAVFPFPVGSHIMPLLNLVLRLAHAAPSCSFSFICTEKSSAAFPFPNAVLPNNIKLYSISDGIPEGHVLGNNPTEKLDLFLKTGPDNLHKGIQLAEAETKQRVTCIIADPFVTSSLLVAKTLDVPWIAFWLVNSCFLSLFFYVDLIRKHCASHAANTTLDFLPGLSKLRVEDMTQDLLCVGEEETVFTKTLVSLGKVLPQAKVVVMNFFEELDPPLFVQDMRSKLQSLLYAVPLRSSLLHDSDPSACMSWLETKSSKSVAYVCFGTTVILPPHEIVAVAEALEESGFPFLWSLKENLMSLLPKGFVERTSMRGKIVFWAPQTQVLAHDSVGVFLTQCGANAVIESISGGVPMICRPFLGEQQVGSRVIEDVWENGMIIEGRMITKNALLKSLNLILVQEEGQKIRDNALEVKKTVQDAARLGDEASHDFKTLVEVISGSSSMRKASN